MCFRATGLYLGSALLHNGPYLHGWGPFAVFHGAVLALRGGKTHGAAKYPMWVIGKNPHGAVR